MEEIAKVVPAIFRSYLKRDTPRVVEVLAPLWSHVVGKTIAEYSRPIGFAGGTLKLGALCPSWGVQLRRMSEEIRTEVNRYLGYALVRKVVVRHGSVRAGSQAIPLKERRERGTAAWDDGITQPRPLRPSRSTRRTADPRPGTQDTLGANVKPAGQCELTPELARILEQSYAKYFSRAAAGTPWRKMN